MSSREEKRGWDEKAAAKGIDLKGVDVYSESDRDRLCKELCVSVEDYGERTRLRAYIIRLQQQPSAWSTVELKRLNIRSLTHDPATTTLVGREPALDFFDRHMRTEPITDHGEFPVFVASGHVRSGKTRLGLELGKHLSAKSGNFIYVMVNLGNGSGYRANFDGLYGENPEFRLGGRLAQAYFQTHEFRPIATASVLDLIFSLPQNSSKNTIVIHFDEHGQYVRDFECDNPEAGPEKSKAFLTKFFDLLCYYEMQNGTKMIIPVASGTTYDRVAVDHDSHYVTYPLPLACLSFDVSLGLARDRMNKKCNDAGRVEQIMESTLFKVAIADAGGLPGAVVWAADSALHDATLQSSSYISELVNRTVAYAKFPSQACWIACLLCSLARPPLMDSSILVPHEPEDRKSKDWTVRRASESGSVLVVNREDGFKEIQVAPCFLAASANSHAVPVNKSIVLAN